MAEWNNDALVSTDWVAQHKDEAHVRLVEVDVDTSAYDSGHVKGAIAWNCTTQLNDQVRRDILGKKQVESLLSHSGITPDTLIVL